MEANKILSSSILDLVFDGRNKAYGAYDLRLTYPQRIKRSMIIVFIVAAIALAGAALGNSFKKKEPGKIIVRTFVIPDVEPDKPNVIPPPKLPKPEPPKIKSVQYTNLRMVNENDVDPPPTTDDMQNARIDVKTGGEIDDTGIGGGLDDLNKGKDIIEKPRERVYDPFAPIEIEAKFLGNWDKFLRQNLNPDIAVENGAPVGKYTVIVQFMVDLDGTVSDIKPLTAHGYGIEEEAVRVLKKAAKWEPAIQNGYKVKAYRRQPITFVVDDAN